MNDERMISKKEVDEIFEKHIEWDSSDSINHDSIKEAIVEAWMKGFVDRKNTHKSKQK